MDTVLLSALQHYAICPRQCALIHMEQIWAENGLTAAGRLLHESVHSEGSRMRDGIRIVTDLELRSSRLGLRGRADAVEFHREGRKWRPFPVEYKKGRPHRDCLADSIQLCGQALCLEEMFGMEIAEGALFYGTPHRRKAILFTPELRERTEATVEAVRALLAGGHLPPARRTAICPSCSLEEQCMPDAPLTVSAYLDGLCEESG